MNNVVLLRVTSRRLPVPRPFERERQAMLRAWRDHLDVITPAQADQEIADTVAAMRGLLDLSDPAA